MLLKRLHSLVHRPQARLLGALSFVALLATGCGQSASTPTPPAAEPQFVEVKPDGTGAPLAPEGRPGVALQTTKRVSALLGGVVECGRHRVVFLPGSLLRDTNITVRDMTPVTGRVEAELYPEGLHFIAPVTLSMRIGDLVEDPENYAIYWYDPLGLLTPWVNLGGLLSLDEQRISTTLLHFSRYRAGKAGW